VSIRNANEESVDGTTGKIADVPIAPSSVTGTDVGTARAYNNGAVSVAFTPDATYWPATSFTATSSPGGFTATASSSPIVVTGLSSQTAYTFTVTGTNSAATSLASSASASVTATTVPQAPVITATPTIVSSTSVTIPFTLNTGGKNITSITAVSSPSISLTVTGTTSPVTVTGSFATNVAYTFTMTATNANGTSSSSSASTSVIPAPDPLWIATLGNSGTETGYGIGVDSSQNVYISYRTNDSTSPSFRTGIAKYNKFGTLQWQKKQSFNNAAYSDCDIIADASGNINVLSNVLTSDSGVVNTKYNTAGVIQWQRGFGLDTSSSCDSISIDASGNTYINGFINNGSAYYSNTVIKYNSSGTFQWAKSLTGTGQGEGKTAVADASGNVYGGGFGGAGFYGITATKFNSSGTLQWIKKFNGPGSTYDAYGGRLTIDSSTNLYQIGTLREAPSVYQAFLIKRDSSGTLQWQRKISNSSSSYGIIPVDVTTDSSGNIYTTNYTLISSVTTAIIAKWNSSGTLQWQRSISGSDALTLGKIKVDSSGFMYIVGTRNVGGNNDALAFRLASDGSGTGTYTVGGSAITYAASSLTEAAGNGVESSSTHTASDNANSSSTTAYSIADTTLASSVVTI